MRGKRVAWPEGLLAPCEYAKGPDGAWYAMTPTGHLANLARHEITEHEDGTLTVSPSILVTPGDGSEPWHGYLTRGVWNGV